MTKQSLTKKQLRQACGCPGYIIDYLYDCQRLPVIRESRGVGYPRRYGEKAIDIINNHINRQEL